MRTVEDELRSMIGDLVLQVASLRVANEQLKMQLKEVEPKSGPMTKPNGDADAGAAHNHRK